MKSQSETHIVQKVSFLNGLNRLNEITQHLHNNSIDNIVFGKWAASLYVHELPNMGPFVVLISPLYLNEKKDALDQALKSLHLEVSKENKYIYFDKNHTKLMLESIGILNNEKQAKRNTVWREYNEMTFKTRSASSIYQDYEEANRPEHEEIRKRIKGYIDSRQFISNLAESIDLDITPPEDASTTLKRKFLDPMELIHRMFQAIESSPLATPLKAKNDLASILEATDKETEERKKLNSKRALLFQAICERLNIQTYLTRFVDIADRFKSFVCVEVLINDTWFLVDPSVNQTSIIETRANESARYCNAILKQRGADCFEIGLGDVESEMQNNSEENNAKTIFLPDIGKE